MSCSTAAIKLVQQCAARIENLGDSVAVLRSVDATIAARWLRDMAEEMRKACEEDMGIPLWRDWLHTLLTKYGYEVPTENTTENDLILRKFVELAYKDLEDELDAISTVFSWRQWALDLMEGYDICDKEALTSPFNADDAQDALAAFIGDYKERIEKLQARVKELEANVGPAFTSDKE